MFRDDMKRYLGLPPYDGPSNICRNDAYFAKDLEKRYHHPINKLVKLYQSGKLSPPL